MDDDDTITGSVERELLNIPKKRRVVDPFAAAAMPFGASTAVVAAGGLSHGTPMDNFVPLHWVVPWKDEMMVEKIMVCMSLPSGLMSKGGLNDKLDPNVTHNGTVLTVKVAWPDVLLNIQELQRPLLKNNVLVGGSDFPLLKQNFTTAVQETRKNLGIGSSVAPYGIFKLNLGCEVDRHVKIVPIFCQKTDGLIVTFNLTKIMKDHVENCREFVIETVGSVTSTPPVIKKRSAAKMPSTDEEFPIPSGIVTTSRATRSTCDGGSTRISIARNYGTASTEFGCKLKMGNYSSKEIMAAKELVGKRPAYPDVAGQPDDEYDDIDSPSNYYYDE